MSTQPKLVADIGGTNARFALFDNHNHALTHAQTLATTDFATIEEAIDTYLSSVRVTVTEVAIAIANPVLGDDIRMTNHHWHFSIKALQRAFKFNKLTVINDFVAQALAVLTLDAHEKRVLADRSADETANKAIIGPGTGLGASILVPYDGQWQALATEGGHVSFAPRTDLEVEIWRYAQRIHGAHISAERFLCGAGLTLIDQALGDLQVSSHVSSHVPSSMSRREASQQARTPQQITSALHENEVSARATIDVFCQMLATVSADLILTAGARGGLYLCGGILPRIADYVIEQSPFYERLTDKGRFSEYVRAVPVYLVTAKDAGLRGAAVALSPPNVDA